MLVKNLVSWAGENFHHMPGAMIDLDDAAAVDRCDAGVASADADELAQARRRIGAKTRSKLASAD